MGLYFGATERHLALCSTCSAVGESLIGSLSPEAEIPVQSETGLAFKSERASHLGAQDYDEEFMKKRDDVDIRTSTPTGP